MYIVSCENVLVCWLPKFSAAKILPNPKFENKRKIFIGGFSKQYGFASQGFLVVRGNGWGFLWSGRHACRRWKGVGVCQGVPRRGEQNPVVIISYKGYSPPKCI